MLPLQVGGLAVAFHLAVLVEAADLVVVALAFNKEQGVRGIRPLLLHLKETTVEAELVHPIMAPVVAAAPEQQAPMERAPWRAQAALVRRHP
jgi:hypothetical protein